jgi:hypothetical protein
MAFNMCLKDENSRVALESLQNRFKQGILSDRFLLTLLGKLVSRELVCRICTGVFLNRSLKLESNA